MSKKVIIVGGGFAGLAAAKKLVNSDLDILLIDKTNHHLFQPLLYQVATASLSPGDIASPIRSVFPGKKNIRIVLNEVVSVNKENSTLTLDDNTTVNFDYLILAPGARHSYFGKNEWEKFAPGLKTLNDALKIREKTLYSLEEAEKAENPQEAKKFLTYVIVGGGPTGVELAGAIAEIMKKTIAREYRRIDPKAPKIYLVEGLPKILNIYPDNLSKKAADALEKLGVTILLNKKVTEVNASGVRLGDEFIETQNVIWAAGNIASPLLNTLNTEQDKAGRIIINKDLSINGYTNIFVLGDAAALKDKHGSFLPAIAPVALQQGKYVAKIIAGDISPEHRKSFVYNDKGMMATIGRAKAIALIKGLKLSGYFAWLTWSFIHIMYLIGFRNRFRVMAEWIWYYFSLKRGVRLIVREQNGNNEFIA